MYICLLLFLGNFMSNVRNLSLNTRFATAKVKYIHLFTKCWK